jgi:hypothetical protein
MSYDVYEVYEDFGLVKSFLNKFELKFEDDIDYTIICKNNNGYCLKEL